MVRLSLDEQAGIPTTASGLISLRGLNAARGARIRTKHLSGLDADHALRGMAEQERAGRGGAAIGRILHGAETNRFPRASRSKERLGAQARRPVVIGLARGADAAQETAPVVCSTS